MIFFTSANLLAGDSGGWKLVRDTAGLRLYTRQSPHSEVREVRAIAFITGTIDEASTVLFDWDEHPRIFRYVKETRLVKKTNECCWTYNVIGFPLTSDRDYLVKTCLVENSDESVSIVWEPFTHPEYPVQSDKIRVEVNRGYWKFFQVKPDEMKVEYYLYTDPAGRLSSWIVNLANRRSVPDTIRSLEREIIARR